MILAEVTGYVNISSTGIDILEGKGGHLISHVPKVTIIKGVLFFWGRTKDLSRPYNLFLLPGYQ